MWAGIQDTSLYINTGLYQLCYFAPGRDWLPDSLSFSLLSKYWLIQVPWQYSWNKAPLSRRNKADKDISWQQEIKINSTIYTILATPLPSKHCSNQRVWKTPAGSLSAQPAPMLTPVSMPNIYSTNLLGTSHPASLTPLFLLLFPAGSQVNKTPAL